MNKSVNLSPQSGKLYRHMMKTGGISALDAMVTYGITSATLARRVCDMEESGVKIIRQRKIHKITKRPYTRYVIDRTVKLKIAA